MAEATETKHVVYASSEMDEIVHTGGLLSEVLCDIIKSEKGRRIGRRQLMKYSYVYFITDSHGHIKIGKADDVVKRLKELQTGNPYRLSTLLTVMVQSPTAAFNLEQELHSQFDEYRLEGEWFEEAPVLELIDTDVVKLNRFEFGGLRYGRPLN